MMSQADMEQAARRLHHRQVVSDFLAGFITSSMYTTATYPIHRVKILLQTQDANPSIVSGRVPRYSFLHAFARLAREQGVAGLWRGNTPYLLRHVPSISLSFGFKDTFRAALPAVDAQSEPWRALAVNACAGGLAGALALAVVYPFEFATIRLAADVGTPGQRQFGQGMMAVWAQAVRQEGLMSAYQGFGVAVGSMMAYKALYFGLYDTAKALAFPGAPHPPLSDGATGRSAEQAQAAAASGSAAAPLWAKAALAAATTFAAASITYPLDIIRKRLVVDVGADRKLYGGGFRTAVVSIWQREGLRGFYRFYAFDMFFRLGGGVILVGYDLIREGHGALPPLSQQQQRAAERMHARRAAGGHVAAAGAETVVDNPGDSAA